MSETKTAAFQMDAPTSQFAADLNAGMAFFLDVTVNLFVIASILIGGFHFPAEVVFGRIIPGSVAGILFGNLAMYWLTRKTREATGNDRLTSIPIGMDLPTEFGMCFFILGPTFAANVATLGPDAAAHKAWVLGMACTVWMAAVKFGLSFFGRAMQRELPQMALVGAMAGIATVWLGAEALYGVFSLPEVGIVSLVIMMFALIAGHRLPFNLPGAVFAIIGGTALYYILAFAGAGDGYVVNSLPTLSPALPVPTVEGFMAVFGDVTNKLGIIIPFALLIAASSVNVVAGAKITGDDFDAGKVVRLDAAATAVSALMGGVVQTTPYFGHATYKRMGARTGYALGAAGVATLFGFLGVIAFASQMMPEAVLKPIFVVVACDILRLAFTGADVRHAPALLFATVPGILNYAYSKVSDLMGRIGSAAHTLSPEWLKDYYVLGAMARGYILTSLIWGALVVWIIDRKLVRAAFAAFTAALFTELGIIHSVLPSSGMYLPWAIPHLDGNMETLPHRLALGYFIGGVLLLLAGRLKNGEDS